MRPAFFSIRLSLRLAAAGALGLSAAACSATDRFANSDPFSNPFTGRSDSSTVTGSVGSAPSGSVSSQPLPPPGGGYQPSNNYSANSYAPNPTRPAPYAANPPRQTYAQPQYKSQYQYNQQSGWSAQGGQTVVVQPGETLFALGTRHGIPASTIAQANNLPPNASLTAGQRIVIPSYRGQQNQAPKPVVAAPQPQKPKPATAARGGSHTVQPGETLFSVARTYNVTATDLARANDVGLDHRVQMGEKLSIPGGARAPQVAQRPAEPAKVQPLVYRKDDKDDQPRQQAAAPAPVMQQQAQTQKATYSEPEPQAPANPVATGGTDFRWPVRGRVISGFGAKPNGQTNDGVNISVPEGTEIKAAEGGVVAYAGNELKGFGNLVLIRHAGEWVTAYAHASEILVKRGDVVRRGQTIARSGKTGSVTTPQLHFEVRRGASPVDPLDHLPQG
jgi:murein DD-endopeptidase MepM/ murein hydrolase activator NlpD